MEKKQSNLGRDTVDLAYKNRSIDLMNEQLLLIEEQKEYAKTIKRHSTITMSATVVMAIATVTMAVIGYLQYCSKPIEPRNELVKSHVMIDSIQTNKTDSLKH